MDIEDKHKQRKGKKTSIDDSRGREDREKKRRRETRRKGGKWKESEEETKIKKWV